MPFKICTTTWYTRQEEYFWRKRPAGNRFCFQSKSDDLIGKCRLQEKRAKNSISGKTVVAWLDQWSLNQTFPIFPSKGPDPILRTGKKGLQELPRNPL
jgi:hypothetical protein